MKKENLSVKIKFEPDSGLIVGEIPSGKSLAIRLSEDPSPLELMLIALGACAAVDAYKALIIRGGAVKIIEISLNCKYVRERNAYLDEISMTYNIEVEKVGRKEAEEAIKLSLEEYCSVGNSLRRKVEIKPPVVKLRKIKGKSRVSNA